MKRIIVVEDQGILRDSISYQLDKNEYDVILKLADASLAYDACKNLNPDLILTNVILMLLVIGIVVGTFGSYRAVRRYLKI